MDQVQLHLKMVTSTKGIFIMDYCMGKESLHGQMGLSMKVSLKITG